MGDFWILLFRYSFGLLCHSLNLFLMTDPKRGRAFTLAAWLGAFVLGTLVIVPILLFELDTGILFVIEVFGTVVVYCTVYLLLSKGPLWRNVFLFFAYATFFIASVTLSSCVSQIFFGGSHLATIAGRTVCLGLYALWMILRPPFEARAISRRLEKGWGCLAAFSIFSGVAFYITALTFMLLKVEVGIRLAVSTVLLALIGSAYLVARRTIILMLQEQEAQEVQSQRKLLETQLATEREFVAQAREYRHNLYHHIRLVADYLEQGDVDGAKTYLGQYQAGLDAETLEVYCENTVANALLSRNARRCAGAGVPFTCRTVIPQTLPLTGPELTTVLGNVLENAWEASRQSEAPWIAFTARLRGNSLLVEVKNGVSGETEFEDDLPVSAKPGRGLGLKSVSRVLERHGGVLRCFRTGDTFFTQIMIPL